MTGKISVVIVTYYTGHWLFRCLNSLLSQTNHANEIILVNNGNSPEVLPRIRNEYPGVTILDGHGNVGFGKACNYGARVATGEVVLFLNPDCELPADALENLESGMLSTDISMMGAVIINEDGSIEKASFRNHLSPFTALVEILGLWRFGFKGVYMRPQSISEGMIEVDCISGAFMAIRRKVFEAVGGFDEEYFLHVEDNDLCKRMGKTMGKTVVNLGIKVKHGGSTSDVSSKFIEHCKARSFNLYMRKHYSHGLWQKMIILPLSMAIKVRMLIRSYK